MKFRAIIIIITASLALSTFARQPERGYRGFIDWSNSVRSQDMFYKGNSVTGFYTGFSTSHGYQINPKFFAGAGIDLEYCSKFENHILSAFAQGRADVQLGRFTPFGDIRLGYSFTDGGGIYFSPSIGYRFNWGRKVGINLGVGYSLRGIGGEKYTIETNPDGYQILKPIGHWRGTESFFSFRVGFDF